MSDISRKEDAERAKAVEKLRKEQAELAAQQKRMAEEKAAAAKAEREAEIQNANLLSAAADAVELLRNEGYGGYLVTLKLAAAVAREPVSA